MGDIEIKLRDAVNKTFDLATGQKHKIRLIRPKVFVLDVEDSHFNFDRKVLLPDLSSTDGSAPVLDTRRVTGLGVMFAALVHAKKNPSQGLFVTGHTDASGAVAYNQKLSEERAANVSLLLRGKRDDWRKLSAKDDAVDDVQTVLTWQSERAGWDCDPEGIDNKAGESTHKAIRGFQERYNAEVAKAQDAGLDSPFKKKITADGNAGPETWGAFYDVYMTELMDLLDLDAFSALEQMQAQFKPPAGMVDFVGCGEHVPFNPARRSPFEEGKDEHLDAPQKNPPDRRVEILFFDPGEEVDLVCHPKPGQCKPDQCPVYIKVPHRQVPIGIPKGLTIAEVNLRLTFVDPEGKIRPFPAGLPIQAKFGDPADDVDPPLPDAEDAPIIDDDDGVDGSADASASAGSPAPAPGEEAPESMEVPQEPTATTGPNGALQFVVPRKASSLFLRLLAGGDKPFVTADPKDLTDTKLASLDELTDAVGQGRVFFQLPKELNTQQGYFDLPDAAGVTFKDGAFLNFDNKETQIGSREAPVELRLGIHWQHFKFEYFDRWTSSLTNVPQPRSKDASGAAVSGLALEGIGQLVETDTPAIRVEARSAWEVVSGKDTVHCLAWVRRETVKGQPRRDLPDARCTARFVTDRLFVRTDGDGSSPDAPRAFVGFADDTPNTPGLERLRLYDLPPEWRSRIYPARIDGETPDKIRPFEQVAGTASTLGKPYVVSLDVVVLQSETGAGPDLAIQLDDSKLANRFTIFDNQLQVFKPDPPSGEPYFTRLADLKPQPTGPVFVDLPPFTRLFARGRCLYDVFDRRTEPSLTFKGAPTGARLAVRLADTKEPTGGPLPMSPTAAPFEAQRANSTNSPPVAIGDARTAVLRCCGHEKGVELFNVIQYVSVAFDFARKLTKDVMDAFPLLKGAVELPSPPPNANGQARDCLLKIADRWNGKDDINSAPGTFEIGAPATARGRYVALLSHGDTKPPPKPKDPLPVGEVRISMIKSGRSFMAGSSAEGFWDLSRLAPDDGRFTAAHETGHIYSQQDEYLNTDDEPSYGQPNIGEAFRSSAAPYGLDRRAMMVNNFEVRARYFWDMLLFARDRGHFGDAKALSVKHGPMTFSTDVTPLDQSRVRFPIAQQLGVTIPPFGLCDLFVYSTGRDEFTSGMDGSAAASPYDGFVMVRVKMAWTVPNTSAFDEIDKFMDRAMTSIRSTFNRKTALAIRARLSGKAVRLRVLFAPRLVCSTFPQGDGAAKYLGSIGDPPLPTPFKKEDYEKHTADLIKQVGVHVNVRIGEGPPGVSGTSIPREALVRDDKTILLIFSNSRFDDDVAAMFGQMVGAPFTRTGTVADYTGLLANLPPELTGIVPEIVP